ncbi:DUF2279 domain-containing protein [Rubrivirga sp. S365]|uniref:DUF2279 domain-containing protein n=1 Tax=Rubrivirga litoralis TaxID=3075598 RepID=A0ABU3BV36_9BACT|nr:MULTISPECIES: DUF2279 domain-containing protein [unclassified Rubrivirga]MDT0633143.1 DUF2279 domain-containing protein [Rubrivirga sp. F394]MDT7855132.1 DUF2279 domain-containing protein [Rubrivirga sp. S365]
MPPLAVGSPSPTGWLHVAAAAAGLALAPLARAQPTPADSAQSAVPAEGPGAAWDASLPDLRVSPPSPDSSGLVWWHVAAAGAGAGALGAAFVERLHVGWWDERSPRFRILGDNAYALNADKIGHAWGAAVLTRTSAMSLEAAGLGRAQATGVAAGAAWAILFVHEVYDGYGPYWGFSPGDVAGNTAGVGWEVAQRHVPALEPFDFKLSFWPSGADERTLMEDYRGQTYWLSVVPHDVAPDAAKPFLPPWLGIAAGTTVRGADANGFPTEREWYLGLDLNVCGLGLRGPLAGPLCEAFRVVHLPMPALRIAPEVRPVLFGY